jgi:hypothetical protein
VRASTPGPDRRARAVGLDRVLGLAAAVVLAVLGASVLSALLGIDRTLAEIPLVPLALVAVTAAVLVRALRGRSRP